MNTPKPQEIYKHFKGNLYRIVTVAEHTETGEMLVVYQALYGDFKIYARPLEMFMSPVDKEKYPDVTQKNRFELFDAATPAIQAEPVPSPKESGLSPKLEAFLDADSYEKRLELLTGMRDDITDDMLTTMAVACDLELKDGPLFDRYEELKGCLLTLERFECNRLR